MSEIREGDVTTGNTVSTYLHVCRFTHRKRKRRRTTRKPRRRRRSKAFQHLYSTRPRCWPRDPGPVRRQGGVREGRDTGRTGQDGGLRPTGATSHPPPVKDISRKCRRLGYAGPTRAKGGDISGQGKGLPGEETQRLKGFLGKAPNHTRQRDEAGGKGMG